MKFTLIFLFITMFMATQAQKDTYGFIHIQDSSKNIAPVYSEAGNFSAGLVSVEKNGKWGFIDADNHEIIAPHYDYARSFQHGQSIVKQGVFYGVINMKGEFVIPPRYYDLKPYELEGKRYYISRDSTFFAGIIDKNGDEVLPHKYTYVMELEGFSSMGSPRLYKHIPFYTTYREIDTAKGSFYEQFSENAFEFGPENGREDIYDAQFHQLASRNTSSYEDQFSRDELTRIDIYLGDHSAADIDEKRKAIRQLLDSPETDGAAPTPAGPALSDIPLSEMELNTYMTQMGYEKFSGSDGKTGVKKDGKILLPAQFKIVKWAVTALFSPPKMELTYLKKHFAGRYKENEEELFMVFGIAAGDEEKGILYTLNGEEAIDITKRIPEKATTAGLIYRTIERDTAEDRTMYRFGCVNWKGQDVLPPIYTRIQLLDRNRMLTKRERESTRGIEEHWGLYNPSGQTIIPEGVFSAIEPIPNTPDLFLAEWSDPYPTKGEQQERELENKHFVLLNIKGKVYTVVQRFTASQVYTRWLDQETSLLKYRKLIK